MKMESRSVLVIYLMQLFLVVIGNCALLLKAAWDFSLKFFSEPIWWTSHFSLLVLSSLVLVVVIVRICQMWAIGGLPLAIPTSPISLAIRRISLILMAFSVASSFIGYAVAFFAGYGSTILLSAKFAPTTIVLLFIFEMTRNFHNVESRENIDS